MARRELYADPFTRADNTDLTAEWDPYIITDEGLLCGPAQIVGNRIRPTSYFVRAEESVNAVSFPDDQWAQCALATFTNVGDQVRFGVMLRSANPPTDTHIEFEAAMNTGTWTSRLAVRVNGFISVSTDDAGVTTWVAGDTLRGEAVGSDLTLYRNDISILSLSNGTLTSGKVGVVMVNRTATPDGNAELDTFSAGDYVAETTGRGGRRRTLMGVGS